MSLNNEIAQGSLNYINQVTLSLLEYQGPYGKILDLTDFQ